MVIPISICESDTSLFDSRVTLVNDREEFLRMIEEEKGRYQIIQLSGKRLYKENMGTNSKDGDNTRDYTGDITGDNNSIYTSIPSSNGVLLLGLTKSQIFLALSKNITAFFYSLDDIEMDDEMYICINKYTQRGNRLIGHIQ